MTHRRPSPEPLFDHTFGYVEHSDPPSTTVSDEEFSRFEDPAERADKSGWWSDISSLFVLGVFDGRTTKPFENNEHGGSELHVRVRIGYLAASYSRLHERAFRPGDRETFSSPPTMPDPGVLQEGRCDNYPWGHLQ